ncbi:hypothetical protein HGH93_14090 [Chitinophaga polysaccharea]|uniref:hypothetical protein n=1 Tax=Chitinophaga TaxID=79328 RepID=UPI001455156A|nr:MULTISPECIES: hypothetical protein [Chitinophaga]NLR59242.1 hypothetical protein [Chitinophaga polysaccharea]NLU91989.1 hypothetical protein [Chitinophaga sp. Ak27]
MKSLLTFKRFHAAEQAAEIISLLEAHHIPVQYEEEVLLTDSMYVGQNFDQRHLVKIPADYFDQADALLKSQINVSLEDVPSDYYLLSFSTEELEEVVIKKDEWGDYDYALAVKLLEKQGISYSPEQLALLRNTRLEILSQPQDLPGIWLFIGYLSPLIIFAPVPATFVLSFLGIFIGAFVRLTKKTLPDGSRIAAFSIKTRNHGKWMIISGILLAIICWTLLIRIGHG